MRVMGNARSAADQRDRRRAPAHQQGRRRLPRRRTLTRMSTTCSSRSASRRPSSPTSRTAGTCSPESARSPWSEGWSRRGRGEPAYAFTSSTPAVWPRPRSPPRTAVSRTSGYPISVRADYYRTDPPRISPARARRPGLLPTGNVCRHPRRPRSDVHRQRHAVRRAACGRSRRDRLRIPGRGLEVERGADQAHRRDPQQALPLMALGDAPSPPSQDLSARPAAGRRHSEHAHVHPGARPTSLYRRARAP